MKKIAFLLGTITAFNLHASTNPWQQLAKADLDFVYQTLKDNHPGVIDEQNPDFNLWLEQGYQQEQQTIDHIEDLAGVLNLQRRYIAGFADGHVGVSFSHQAARLRWPGFIVHQQGADTVVTMTASNWPADLPAVGSILKHCDGLTPQQLLEQKILPYKIQLPELTAVQTKNMPLILRMDDSWQGDALTQCEFSHQNSTFNHSLTWRNTSQHHWQQQNAALVANTEFSLHSFAPNSYWITLPTFTPSSPQQDRLKQITSQLTELRDAEMIVFDVRGNGGGNSQWGTDMAIALYGKDHVYSVISPLFSQQSPYWRASPDNTAAVVDIVETVSRQFGPDSEATQVFSDLAVRMAEKGSHQLVPQRKSNSASAQAEDIEQSPALSRAKVVLLTDAHCASACLDFADVMLPLGAYHAGHPTFADTVYMDVRFVELPSKLGHLAVPQKVYRNRLRGHNEPYTPATKWLYPGNIADTETVRGWLLQQMTGNEVATSKGL